MTVLLLAPLVLLAVYYAQAWPQSSQQLVTRAVGLSVKNFADSLAADFPRAVEISGKSAAAAAVNQVVSNGSGVDDAELRTTELAVNGTFYGETSYFMQNNSMAAWVSRLQNKSIVFGMNATIQITNYSATPYDAFHLLFNASLSVNASNADYEINFSRSYNAVAIVSIEGLEDPLYALNTRGLMHRAITANASRVYGTTALEAAAALDAAVTNASYVPASEAPCFFDRLEGNTNASQLYAQQAIANSGVNPGIETFVNTLELYNQGIDVDANASIIDHEYFNATVPCNPSTRPCGSSVNQSTISWLKLDCSHAAVYGVTLIPHC